MTTQLLVVPQSVGEIDQALTRVSESHRVPRLVLSEAIS
jgi:hypothetical protein